MGPRRSFEELFHETRPGLHWRLWRDLRCAGFLAAMVARNLIVGRRVRKRYLACRAAGEPFWLDEGNAPGQGFKLSEKLLAKRAKRAAA